MEHGYTPNKDDYIVRLRRIEGQVRGLQGLIENDTYCIDVLTQISAVRSALNSVAVGLAHDHIGHCVVNAAKQSDEAGEEKVAEVTATIARLVKS